MFLVTAHARSEVIRAPLSFLCEAASGEELDWSERRPPKNSGESPTPEDAKAGGGDPSGSLEIDISNAPKKKGIRAVRVP